MRAADRRLLEVPPAEALLAQLDGPPRQHHPELGLDEPDAELPRRADAPVGTEHQQRPGGDRVPGAHDDDGGGRAEATGEELAAVGHEAARVLR